ncbi:kinetochore-associated protein DSN1 homolog isoform X1 [Phycodurus eques]|uniref:kinetochore-associated protein DSN1 homolog isoform X1 n=1 Tax=Phycodurus eques TaxID=693459 RepID=UPI002ACE4201|nr:kinetochore-associated protein DSN1 homolog isoform X1 [Phycodurus eques]
MAEEPSSTDRDGCESGAAVETTNEVKLSPKRCSSSSAPDGVPPQKSPRIEMLLTSTRTLDAGEEHPDMDRLEMASGSTAEPETCSPVNRTARRKSWRRATMTRRSLSALPNPHQTLCKSISTSLSQRERLSILMEAAIKLATDRLQNSLQSLPNSSSASFQKQVEKMKKKCSSVGKCISSEQQSQRTAEPAVQKAMVIQNTINRIQAESQSWEALSHKHRSKAEELERKLADGQKKAISFDHTCMAQSSQYQLIRSKPDYHALLRRQQSMLQTMTLVTDIQYKLASELQSIKEVSQSMVKEISGRLAAQAGFQDHSPNVIKDLIVALIASASTVTLNGGKPSV